MTANSYPWIGGVDTTNGSCVGRCVGRCDTCGQKVVQIYADRHGTRLVPCGHPASITFGPKEKNT